MFFLFLFLLPVIQLLLRFGDTPEMTQLSIALSLHLTPFCPIFFSLSASHCTTLFCFDFGFGFLFLFVAQFPIFQVPRCFGFL